MENQNSKKKVKKSLQGLHSLHTGAFFTENV